MLPPPFAFTAWSARMPDDAMSVNWRVYVDAQDKAVLDTAHARLDGIDRAITVALEANATAINKADAAIAYRLALLNEFQASLKDQTTQLATKSELEAIRSRHDAEIKGLSKQVYIITGALAALQVLLQFMPTS